MTYSLDLYIICNDQTVIDAIKAKVPLKVDSSVWAEDYTLSEIVQEDGNKALKVSVRFNESSKRQVALDWIKTKAQQVAGQILPGSWVGYHECPHDEKKRCGQITKLWSK